MSNATYSALNQAEQAIFGNGVWQTWTYGDTLARLTQVRFGPSSNLGQFFNRNYGYDLGSNVTAITDANTAANMQSYT